MVKKNLTMGDIAKLAGVGKSTVSRYFNGGYVKEETKEKIQKICEENHYHPSKVAQMLKAKRTNTVGIITPTLTSHTSARTITIIDDYLKERGFQTIIVNTNHDEQREADAFKYLSELNVDGIVILATHRNYDYQSLKEELEIPILFMGQEIEDAVSIIYNDYESGYEVGKRVYQYGHTDIAFLGVDESDTAVGVNRKNGVLDALQDMGISDVRFIKADFEHEKCLPIVEDFLKKHVPTMIVCATDRMAIACYKALAELNLKIPEDVSLIGFGSYRYSNLLNPPLESIRFHNNEAGVECAKTILAMIEGSPVEKRKVICSELIEGESMRKLK